jgi:hypothetical protein
MIFELDLGPLSIFAFLNQYLLDIVDNIADMDIAASRYAAVEDVFFVRSIVHFIG